MTKRDVKIQILRNRLTKYKELETKHRKRSKKGNRAGNLRLATYYEQLTAETATQLVLDYGEFI